MFVSVDLPIPGEPPSSTSEPGTRPPPSTRSSSPMPVDMRVTGAEPTSPKGSGTSVGRETADAADPTRRLPPVRPPWPRAAGRRSSTSVFHASQPGHWPCHCADWKPHCEQRGWCHGTCRSPAYASVETAQSALSPRRRSGCDARTSSTSRQRPSGICPIRRRRPRLEAAALVQGDGCGVLGEDAGPQRPEALALGCRDQRLQQRAADPTTGAGGVDVDAHLADPPVDGAAGHRAEGGPSERLPATVAVAVTVVRASVEGFVSVAGAGDQRGVTGALARPVLPGRRLGLEGRVAAGDAQPRRCAPRPASHRR